MLEWIQAKVYYKIKPRLWVPPQIPTGGDLAPAQLTPVQGLSSPEVTRELGEEGWAFGKNLLILSSRISDKVPPIFTQYFVISSFATKNSARKHDRQTRGYSQSRGSEFVKCFLNCSFRSLLTPISWNMRWSLEVYSNPQACWEEPRWLSY